MFGELIFRCGNAVVFVYTAEEQDFLVRQKTTSLGIYLS